MFPHVCGTCETGFKTASKLVSHLAKRGRCKPAAAEVGGDGDQLEVGVVAQLNILAEQLQAVPGASGDSTTQAMNLAEGDLVLHVAEGLEQLLRTDTPVTFLVAPGGADGSLELQPMH